MIECDFERLDAIRRMMNAPDGERIILSTGEVVLAWSCLDENFKEIGIEVLPDEEIIEGYNRFLDWNCPESCK